MSYYTSSGKITSVTCSYQPQQGQPQYPPLPGQTQSSVTTSINDDCVSYDAAGNALAYWQSHICIMFADGSYDASGVSCSNPVDGTPAYNVFGATC